MKTIYYFTLLMCVVACKRESSDSQQVNIVTPQKVFYNIYTKSNTRKHIEIELYSVVKGTTIKGQLVARIDTVLSDRDIVLSLTQNINPVVYCITSLKVSVLDNNFDTISLTIGNDKKHLIKHSYSCLTQYLDIENAYINLLIGKL